VLTEAGRIAFNYANEMFSLSQEMLNALEHRQAGTAAIRLTAGVVDVIPKPMAKQLLAPALSLHQPVRLICREEKSDRLLADLAARRGDQRLPDRRRCAVARIQPLARGIRRFLLRGAPACS
jgi:LysR family transcriptional activator of nhaA